MHIATAIKFSFEEALECLQDDEYVEITPKGIRLHSIYLDDNERVDRQNQMDSAAK